MVGWSDPYTQSYTGPAFVPVAQNIHGQMTTNAAIFPTPPVTMPNLAALVSEYQTRLAAKASRAIADQTAFNLTRHDVEDALGNLRDYVNTIANGDQTIIEQSGFPSYNAARTHLSNPPAAPTGLELRRGDLSGTVVSRYHPDRTRSMNEVETNLGDPNTPAGWAYAGMFSGGRTLLGSLTPGANVWVRVRTGGLGGVMGAWSDPARIMVV